MDRCRLCGGCGCEEVWAEGVEAVRLGRCGVEEGSERQDASEGSAGRLVIWLVVGFELNDPGVQSGAESFEVRIELYVVLQSGKVGRDGVFFL